MALMVVAPDQAPVFRAAFTIRILFVDCGSILLDLQEGKSKRERGKEKTFAFTLYFSFSLKNSRKGSCARAARGGGL